jgi:UDP-2-acetamido-2-deoxy-ribo-hexuluronate aminotransferase
MTIQQVPFITLNRFENGFRDEFLQGVSKLFDNTQFVGGPIVGEVEKGLAEFIHSKHAIGCANGTDAIQIALRAVGVKKNDLVLVPDMTFWATFEAVVNVGANPVTVDVNRETCHWDLATFTQAIKQFKPKAAIMVHLYGWASPDTLEIRKVAKENGVLLIEDGAQCFGTKIKGESILGTALISTTSFYPAKVLGASGDAGAIFTNSDEYNDISRKLINHGRVDHYSHGHIGWNSRIGAYESLFLNLSLKHIQARIDSRMKAVDFYHKELTGLPFKILKAENSISENGYCSVGMIDPTLRGGLIEHLKNHKIGFGTIYPGAMSMQSGAKEFLAGKIDNGSAHFISQAVLNLPCFAYMSDAELEFTVDVVKKYFK